MKKILIWVSVILVIIGTFLSLWNIDFSKTLNLSGIIALIIGAISSIISIFIPSKYIQKFSENDWKVKDSGSFFLMIMKHSHGMGETSKVTLYAKSNGGYEVVTGHVGSGENGNIIITSNSVFNGKVVIN